MIKLTYTSTHNCYSDQETDPADIPWTFVWEIVPDMVSKNTRGKPFLNQQH